MEAFMRDESLEFLKELLWAPSPSGFEEPAQAVVRSYMRPVAQSVRTDVHGNVIAALNETGRPRVMLAGHCDEIGLMVTHVDDQGFLAVSQIGGWDAANLVGQQVTVHTASGPVLGVVARKAIHAMTPEERNAGVKLDDLWVDIGAKDKDDALEAVRVGDPITVGRGFDMLRGTKAVSRCFDDKMGTWVVMETLRLLLRRKVKAAVFAVSTVQEEIGLRGAITSAFGIEPDVGVAVDVTHAADSPGDSKPKRCYLRTGDGPVIERGANINKVVERRLIEAAEAKKIPYQLAGSPGATGTDANAIQISRAGVASGLIGVPVRYMHAPTEVLDLQDLENSARLLAEFIARLDPGVSFVPE